MGMIENLERRAALASYLNALCAKCGSISSFWENPSDNNNQMKCTACKNSWPIFDIEEYEEDIMAQLEEVYQVNLNEVKVPDVFLAPEELDDEADVRAHNLYKYLSERGMAR